MSCGSTIDHCDPAIIKTQVEEAAKVESDVLNKRRKVSTASPAPSSMWRFAELLAGDATRGYRPLS